MEIIRGIDNYNKNNQGIFLGLGNFDGLHLGHQKLLEEVVNEARKHEGLATAFIFDPHPNKIINPEKAPKLITSNAEQAKLLEKIGLDLLIYNPFTKDISKWEPEEFVQRIIVSKFKAKHIFVGFNYSFGHKGKGSPDLLQELGVKYGFKVSVISPVEVEGQVVSSTFIRAMLEEGNIKKAVELLGYYPVVTGTVVPGEQRGSKLGFPTANLAVSKDILVPGKGVYAAKAYYDGIKYNCVVNIGSKPTFYNNHPVTIEVHIMDFAEDIYDKSLSIYFLDKVREEKKFNGIEELVKQINLDKELAYKIANACSS